jgi:hypothetical protein
VARNGRPWTTNADAFVVGVDDSFGEGRDGSFGGGVNGVTRQRRGAAIEGGILDT